VCDVGCYLGASSNRWKQYENNLDQTVQVLGTDIHASNIRQATEAYPGITFQLMEDGGKIPLLDNHRYQLMFATFVLDTIPQFNDVSRLCARMVEALVNGGTLILLRLHPNALTSNAPFQEYRLPVSTVWSHGDSMPIQLVQTGGDTVNIHDTFWHPERIENLFEDQGCAVEQIPLHVQNLRVQPYLAHLLEQYDLSSSMPEWTVPLYQLIRIVKKDKPA
jgi:hypothetical protein